MYAERIAGLKSSAIRDILKLMSRPGIISFAGGLPAPELFPVKEISEAVVKVLSKYSSSALQYSITEGLIPLREKIIKKLDPDSRYLSLENIIITQGSQQGLDLISKLFLDKGNVVFTETPSYIGALQSFQLFQADIIAIPSDEKGIRVDELENRLKIQKPKLIYLMPNFQNPTGASLPMDRRYRLIEIAGKHDFMAIEDDPYGELIFEGEKLPSLFSLAQSKNFIYMSSFSKTVAPGFRVAYVIADKEIIKKFAIVKQGTDLHTNTFGQYLVNEYLENGNYHEHINLIRETYKVRRDCMLSAMEKYFPKSAKWNKPAGGMFIWTILPEGYDAREILMRCIEKDVAFVPGQEFFPDGSGKNTMRLNFSNATTENIEEGIRRIGEVLIKISP
ncbi:MAG: PLP-dependent aminotransferase family protein [Thermodesulfovibrionales bacterium]|nr:PLP-dependent aminotransferase family protein [Thermodesulfovibrionales bacterium]